MHARIQNLRMVALLVVGVAALSITAAATPPPGSRPDDGPQSPTPASTEQSTSAPPAADQPASSPPDSDKASTEASDPRHGLLTPIPETGGLPPIFTKLYERQHSELAHRAITREYGRQFRQIRSKYFGQMRSKQLRAEGLAQLKEFTDPAAFMPMITELKNEQDDVRLAMLDHFGTQGPEGQAALAWVVIYDDDTAIRNEALMRMTTPVPQSVLYVIDQALRSPKAEVANAAAVVVSSLNIVQAIPLMIFGQVSITRNEEPQGDLAWIAIQTQRAYVAGLQPVVGSNAGAFQPVIGVVSSGSILRIHDAVVIEYRTVVNSALVNMTTDDWGQSTASLGYNVRAWWDWYNNEYLPAKTQQAQAATTGRSSTSREQ